MCRLFAFLFVFALHTSLYAQIDEQPIGCHHIKHQIHQQPLTQEQQAWVQASAERSDTFDILHYDIALSLLRFDESILEGNTLVEFRAKMDQLDHINLDLEGLQVLSVTNGSGKDLSYSHDDLLIRVDLDTILNTDEEYAVRVIYEGTPITCPSGFGGFYFEDGYAYNLGIGLAASPHNFGRAWFPCFDNFVERSTYTYRLTAHDGRVPYGLGTLVETNNIGGDTIERVFEMMEPIPTYLSHVAISNYEEVTYLHQGQFGAVPVRLVAKPQDTANLRTSFNVLGDVLDCMEDWYGPYPFEVIGYNITTRGAMEHPTGVAYPISSIADGGTNLGLITHELAHHWWGNITTLSSEFDMWLKEGPASYSEQQIIEYLEGQEAFERAVKANNVNMIRTAHIADEGFWPLSPMPDQWTYGRTTYDKGAAMLHNLRGYLGDSLFKIGMQNVLAERAYESINAAQLRDQLIEATNYDLTSFFDNWIFGPGWSDFVVEEFTSSPSGNEYTVSVKVRQELYGTDELHTNVPLRLAFVKNGEATQVRTIMASGELSEDVFSLPFEPDFVFANPDNHLNLASAGDLYWIEENQNDRLPFTSWRLTVENVADRFPFQITHHYTSPEDEVPDTIPFRLSKSHYWTVHMADNNADLSGRIEYLGLREENIDYDLVSETEDSLILLYRRNGEAPWLEYPYYTKQTLIPNDGRGSFSLEQILPGQYTFANGPSGIYLPSPLDLIEEISVFPNPVQNQLNLKLKEFALTPNSEVRIIDMNGRLLKRQEIQVGSPIQQIDLSVINSGTYFVQLQSGNKLYQSKIIKQ